MARTRATHPGLPRDDAAHDSEDDQSLHVVDDRRPRMIRASSVSDRRDPSAPAR